MKFLLLYRDIKLDMIGKATRKKPVIVTSFPIPDVPIARAKKWEKDACGVGSLTDLIQVALDTMVKPAVMELAKKIINGELLHNGVEACDEGFKVKNPLLARELARDLEPDYELFAKARLALISDLTKLGFRVALLFPDPMIRQLLVPGLLEEAQKHGVNFQDIVFLNKVREEGQFDNSLGYTRDLFTQIYNRVYMHEQFQACDWCGMLDLTRGLTLDWGYHGLDGLVDLGADFAILCQYQFPEIGSTYFRALDNAQGLLQGISGKREVFRIPHRWLGLFSPEQLDELGTEKQIFYPLDHGDMSMLHFPYERAIYVLASYYIEHQELIDRIMDKVKPNIFGILPDEIAINSLPLPYGGAYVDGTATRSIEILRGDGIPVVESSAPLAKGVWGAGAGIHCASNTLWVSLGDERDVGTEEFLGDVYERRLLINC